MIESLESVLRYKSIFLSGAVVTLMVAFFAYLFSFFLALTFLFFRKRVGPRFRKLIDFYPQIFRGLPELLIIFFLFYGSGLLLSQIFSQELNPSPMASGVFALTVVYSAFIFEVLRGAQASLNTGEALSAKALGLRPLQIFLFIEWPSIWRVAIPSLGNLWLSLIKETALVSIIGLSDLSRAATIASEATQMPFTTYFVAALIYLFITVFSMLGQKILVQKFHSNKEATRV